MIFLFSLVWFLVKGGKKKKNRKGADFLDVGVLN
jgi:hypothetical protein